MSTQTLQVESIDTAGMTPTVTVVTGDGERFVLQPGSVITWRCSADAEAGS